MDSVIQLKGGGRTLVGVSDKTLEYYEIPETVTSIAKRAFKNCTQLREIKIHGNVKNIGAEAFESCSSLRTVIISEGVEKIGKGAFRGCCSLNRVTMPNSLKEINDEAFRSLNLTRVVCIQLFLYKGWTNPTFFSMQIGCTINIYICIMDAKEYVKDSRHGKVTQ